MKLQQCLVFKGLYKYPYQFFVGQKQRTAASRAIIDKLKLIIADDTGG